MKIFAVLALLAACGSAAKAVPPETTAEEASVFGSQLSLCVQTARTRDDADKCRASVERTWCGKGGPLSNSSGCEGYDGGAP